MKRISLFMFIISLLVITGCGGGGGSTPAAPTKAIVKVMTVGILPDSTLIGGIDVAMNLPAGVSVKATPDTDNPGVLVTDSGVVTVSGVAAGANTMAIGTYTTNTNTVAVHVVNADGFGTGEFATIICDIASSATVTAGSITAPTLSALDRDHAAPITGLKAGITVELQ